MNGCSLTGELGLIEEPIRKQGDTRRGAKTAEFIDLNDEAHGRRGDCRSDAVYNSLRKSTMVAARLRRASQSRIGRRDEPGELVAPSRACRGHARSGKS